MKSNLKRNFVTTLLFACIFALNTTAHAAEINLDGNDTNRKLPNCDGVVSTEVNNNNQLVIQFDHSV
jgi:hypothetical protein